MEDTVLEDRSHQELGLDNIRKSVMKKFLRGKRSCLQEDLLLIKRKNNEFGYNFCVVLYHITVKRSRLTPYIYPMSGCLNNQDLIKDR